MAEGRQRRAATDTGPVQSKGWLYKWTNYIKGYQRRWFVLSDGLLSYSRTQEEMAHTCRGTVNLAGAFIDPIDATHFVVSNGQSQVYHLRAGNSEEKQRWVTALTLAKTKAIKSMESDSGEDTANESNEDDPLAGLQHKLKELSLAHDVVVKNGHGLTKMIGELEKGVGKGIGGKLSEQLALFKLTALGMIKASDEFVIQARNAERKWSKTLQHEENNRIKLQENMETLAEELTRMEDQAKRRFQGSLRTGSLSSLKQDSTGSEISLRMAELEEDDQFFDAPEMSDSDLARTGSAPATPTLAGIKGSLDTRSVNEAHGLVAPSSDRLHPVSPDSKITVPDGPAPSFLVDIRPTIAHRRTTVPPKPDSRVSLWSIVKNAIGKDISKIPMPVNFNEPLSLLQRITEEMQYAEVLDKAVNAQDTLEEMAYVGAFVTSPYAATAGLRANKPFNPLLGETFECDRRAELGWRCLFEQVSHHPPMFAEYTEGRDWTFWQEYTAAYNFRGKYVTILPLGTCHLVFHKTKSHYTWCKCVTTVHNIIVGKLWIDQSGDIKFTNHTTREEGLIKFHAYSYFSRERQRKVTGHMKDVNGKIRYVIKGYWDQQYDVAKVTGGEGKNLETGPYNTLWRARQPEPGNEIMYGFSHFAASLNEHEPGVAPTDSRFRPDQRIMEEGDFPKANEMKVALEEKQRTRRRKREALAEQAAAASARGDVEEAERLKKEATFKPMWFTKEYDPLTNTLLHVYKGGYWEAKQAGDWDKLNLPDIF